MKKKRKRNKSIILRLLIVGVCVYMIATLAGLWNTLAEKQEEKAELQQEINISENEIKELKELLEEGSESRIIEKAARERLGYVYPDEQVFVDISGS